MSYKKYAPQDLQLDPDGDLLIKDGDFVPSNCESQNLFSLLSTNQGEWRFAAGLGVGLPTYLNSVESDVWARLRKTLRLQCEACSMELVGFKVLDNKNVQTFAKFK